MGNITVLIIVKVHNISQRKFFTLRLPRLSRDVTVHLLNMFQVVLHSV